MSDEPGTAVVEPVAPSADGGAGSAPARTTDGSAGGEVDTPEEGRTPNQLPKWAYNMVRENRAFKRQLAELQERLAAQPRTSANGEGSTPKDVWTDPDAWADAKIEKSVQASIRKAEIQRQKTEAYQYIRSQKDVTPENEDEIAAIMEREGYGALLERNPKKAVDLALRDWREENGVTAPAADTEKNKLAKAQARGVAGTSAAGAGSKKWSEAEIVEIAKDPEKWAKHGPDIMAYLKSKQGRTA